MSISITFNCDTAIEALSELQAFAGGMRPALGSLDHVRQTSEAQIKMAAEGTPAVSDPSADKSPEPAVEPAKTEEKPAPKPRGRPKKDEPVVTPQVPAPEVAAQDAADEAAEAEPAVQDPEEPEVFTRDSIRKELGAYATAYGMEHALTDGPSIIEAKNASAVEETQEALGKATRALRAAIVSNPFERTPANAAA